MTTTSVPVRPKPTSQAWPELDIFRGLAVVAMIANHAVVRWQGSTSGFTDLGRFFFEFGGVAPVLFFFATGFGSGLQSLRPAGSAQHRYGLARKVTLLILADQFLRWRFSVSSEAVGLDFLGFIALSTLLVEPLRRAKRATTIALLGAAGILAVRFALSPWILPDPAGNTDLRWLAIATGRVSLQGLAYPPFPWLIYPLLGFALGRGIGGMRSRLEAAPLRVAAVLAATTVGGLAGAYAMTAAGFEINRYGVHSLAYLPIGATALATAGAIAWGLGQLASIPTSAFARIAPMLSVRGVASLVAVPIHLALLFAIDRSEFSLASDPKLAAGIAAMTALSLAAGRSFSRMTEGIENAALAQMLAAALVVLLIFATWWPLTTGPWTRHGFAYAAQLALCGLLVWGPAASARRGA